MRGRHADFDFRGDPYLERDLDAALRLFFRGAAQPAAPPSLELAIERLPARRFRDRFGLPSSRPFVRPMKALVGAVGAVLAVAIVAGLLGRPAGFSSTGSPARPTPVVVPPVGLVPHIAAMGRLDAATGWVEIWSLDPQDTDRGRSYLRWTFDGGKTWSERRPVLLPRTEMSVGATQFVDARHGWTGSYSPASGAAGGKATVTIWRTSDAGLAWQGSTIELDSSPVYFGGFHFRDELHGEAFEVLPSESNPSELSTTCGRFSTSDGGATWSGPEPMACMAEPRFVDASFGYAGDPFDRPVLYVTQDGGRTWTAGALPAEAQGSKYQVPMLLERRSDGSLRGLVTWTNDAGSVSAIVASGDGGGTWTLVGAASADRATTQRYGLPIGLPLAARDEDHWLTAPLTDDRGTALMFGSGDGGLTWGPFPFRGITGQVGRFDFLNGSDGWASTETGDTVATLWATTDGGATWTSILATP